MLELAYLSMSCAIRMSSFRNTQGRPLRGGTCQRQQPAYCVEEVERQQFREVSDIQAVGDRSTAAVLASLGWQNFYLNVNVPAFFNTIGQKRTVGN